MARRSKYDTPQEPQEPQAPKNWLDHALQDLGVSEIVGPEDNPRIVRMHDYTTLDANDDETSWCSSAMNCWMAESGLPYTKSAAARSWLTWGAPLEVPVKGCVVVLKRDGGPNAGHVGFYIEDMPGKSIKVFGGNQSNKVGYSVFRKSDVLGYRWPLKTMEVV